MYRDLITILTVSVLTAACACAQYIPDSIGKDYAKAMIARFNADDTELYKENFPNDKAESFILKNVPLFDCPDDDLKSVYYFRWWTFRKHLKLIPGKGWIITEFMPKVSWGGKYNAISCPAALQLREARWLKDSIYADDYLSHWCFDAENAFKYSTWFAAAALDIYAVRGDIKTLKKWYPMLKRMQDTWDNMRYDANVGLYWQTDGQDGMEISASGQLNMQWAGYRATINSYMAGNYRALARIAQILGLDDQSKFYSGKAETIKKALNDKLWDAEKNFYMVRPRNGDAPGFSPHRELHGYTPWYFNLAPEEYSQAWAQVVDDGGFKAPYGLTTLERRSSLFQINYIGHECQWNGPSWPFSTSITLSGMANFLRAYPNQKTLTKKDFFDALLTYARSHKLTGEDGKKVYWIDENLNPFTGDWIARTRLKNWENGTWRSGIVERGKDYNHSFFAELILRDIAGIMPQCSRQLKISPLAPDGWKYYAVEDVKIQGKSISVIWDSDGTRYNRGKGFFVFVDGALAAHAEAPSDIAINLQ